MGKKIIVNERVLKHILMEMTKETTLINEAISVANAYAKFYSTKLTEEEYNAAVNGTVNMTPYHKALLDAMITAKENGFENWLFLAKECGNIWANSDANIRQLLLKAVKSNELNPKNLNGFYEKSLEISQTKAVTKAQVANNGLITLYEDEKVLITCTTTYSASHKFYADSHWCTASDIYGQYNGYCMFLNYTTRENSCLIQIVPKNYRMQMFQMQSGLYGPGQICDFDDNGCDFEEMTNNLGLIIPNITEILENLTTEDEIKKLIWRTKVESKEDSKYWIPKTEERIAEITEEINQKAAFSDSEETVSFLLGKCINYRRFNESSYDDGISIAIFASDSLDEPYFLLRYEIDVDKILNNEASSWLWSCKRAFKSAVNANLKLFLCKMTAYDEAKTSVSFEIVKQIDDYLIGLLSINNLLGYCTKSTDEGNMYTIINRRTGEDIFTNEYISYFNRDFIIMGTNDGPYKIYSTKKMKVVLTDITGYYLDWGDLYVTNKEIEKSPRALSNGYIDLTSAIRYYGQ